jgi:hypothetical protein
MIIVPATHMMNSKMISGIEAEGRKFAVNLNTGVFGVLPSEHVERPTIYIIRKNMQQKALSKNFETFLRQITFEFENGAGGFLGSKASSKVVHLEGFKESFTLDATEYFKSIFK